MTNAIYAEGKENIPIGYMRSALSFAASILVTMSQETTNHKPWLSGPSNPLIASGRIRQLTLLTMIFDIIR